ncbi:MAG: bifunctional 4-hydroxy-2-oxoglutarate aldolase/2-dehydro-3-deoxy-phosphogluconate aldolase [Opitutaceae bacterium]|jgi:2-dehydro-3-deoxyphosphogluconate aldolase/(4S)-4-hydroxy-2-oxoglutarate aldolase|nr:bifunctional 4-hydroxy-2-oxoglutarate aldolase/2-dehydro-3-deoxy-phosphogluconate aldolase [Opitutaceae bacterium]
MRNEIERRKLVAVVTLPGADSALPVANALLAGGVTAIELTLRTPAALEGIARIRAALPGMLVGAGTVLTPAQVEAAKAAGARFCVAPGANPRTLAAARAAGVFFAPGVFTPSDIETALEAGCSLLKYFPAASLGLAHLRAMAAPYRHLGVRFMPTGGVSQSNLAATLAEPLVAAVGGSWLATPDLIKAGDFAAIRERARAAAVALRDAHEGGTP